MTTAAQVLTQPELFLFVAAFQNGSVQDLVPYSSHWTKLQKSRSNLAWHWAMYFTHRLETEGDKRHRILHLMRSHFPERISSKFLDVAAERGDLDVIKFATPQFRCTISALDYAATEGHLEIVEYLHKHRSEGCTTRAMNGAASNGHLKVVEFLDENRTEGCTSDAMDAAASHGHLQVVQYLHKHRNEGCSTHAFDSAARNGHLDVVQFLFENRTNGCAANALKYAISYKRYDVIAFLEQYRSKTPHLAIPTPRCDQGNECMRIKVIASTTRAMTLRNVE